SVSIVSPTPAAGVLSPATITVRAFDDDDNAAASAVWVQVDSQFVQAAAVPGSTTDWRVTVPLSAGPHTLVGIAYDAKKRVDSAGKPIFSPTAPPRGVG